MNGEFEKKNKNHKHLLHNFSLEARLQINKKAKNNFKPEINLDLIIGGKFKEQNQIKELSIDFNVY